MRKKYHLYIFDADGTLRRCIIPNQPCPNRAGEWELMPNVKERLSFIDWTIAALGIASNQAGIALGYLTQETAYELLKDMVVEATGFFPPTNSIRICPHGVNDGCGCRKPAAGMLLDLMLSWDCLPKDTLYIGDMESDKQAAENAGCDFMYSSEFFKQE